MKMSTQFVDEAVRQNFVIFKNIFNVKLYLFIFNHTDTYDVLNRFASNAKMVDNYDKVSPIRLGK